jgi:hypothetical protein
VPIGRIKSTWREERERSVDEIASALAFIAWRIALEGAKDLHGEGYRYDSDPQRVAVMAEFVAFLVQVADRLCHEIMADEDREAFVNACARRLADQVQDNLSDLFGPGDYRGPFIETLNSRLADYSELSFADGRPGYDVLRYFGDRVQRVMGRDQTNRWVIDQIMERSGPEAAQSLHRSLLNLLG